VTAAEYRKHAEQILKSWRPSDISERTIRLADVWARLAVSAAISETGQETTDANH
jgi:hypothetical protein